jgi:hypothetical protein
LSESKHFFFFHCSLAQKMVKIQARQSGDAEPQVKVGTAAEQVVEVNVNDDSDEDESRRRQEEEEEEEEEESADEQEGDGINLGERHDIEMQCIVSNNPSACDASYYYEPELQLLEAAAEAAARNNSSGSDSDSVNYGDTTSTYMNLYSHSGGGGIDYDEDHSMHHGALDLVPLVVTARNLRRRALVLIFSGVVFALFGLLSALPMFFWRTHSFFIFFGSVVAGVVLIGRGVLLLRQATRFQHLITV